MNMEILGATPTPALKEAINAPEPKSYKPTYGELVLKVLTSPDSSKKVSNYITTGKVIQDGGGHDLIVWDRHYADQIAEAREKFFSLLDQGYHAFTVTEDGKPKKKLTRFDPTLEEIFMSKDPVNVTMYPRTFAG